jgi:CO/xanthine dehydrogenase Mo-binding subunit
VALASFTGTTAGAVADISVNMKTGKITVDHLYVSQDNGVTFYPEGGNNNSLGAVVQGVSRTIVEGLNFDTKYVTGLDWVTYPMLRFKDSPNVTMSTLQRFDVPDVTSATLGANGQSTRNALVENVGSYAGGSGEPGLSPVAGAIGNAFYDATGVRIHEAPMTPARVRAALKAAGK